MSRAMTGKPREGTWQLVYKEGHHPNYSRTAIGRWADVDGFALELLAVWHKHSVVSFEMYATDGTENSHYDYEDLHESRYREAALAGHPEPFTLRGLAAEVPSVSDLMATFKYDDAKYRQDGMEPTGVSEPWNAAAEPTLVPVNSLVQWAAADAVETMLQWEAQFVGKESVVSVTKNEDGTQTLKAPPLSELLRAWGIGPPPDSYLDGGPRPVTGRLTQRSPELQNIPIRTEDGQRLRESLRAMIKKHSFTGGLVPAMIPIHDSVAVDPSKMSSLGAEMLQMFGPNRPPFVRNEHHGATEFDVTVAWVHEHKIYNSDAQRVGPDHNIIVGFRQIPTGRLFDITYDPNTEAWRTFIAALELPPLAGDATPFTRLPGRRVAAELDANGILTIVGPASGFAEL